MTVKMERERERERQTDRQTEREWSGLMSGPKMSPFFSQGLCNCDIFAYIHLTEFAII